MGASLSVLFTRKYKGEIKPKVCDSKYKELFQAERQFDTKSDERRRCAPEQVGLGWLHQTQQR